MARDRRPLYVQIAEKIRIDYAKTLGNGLARLPSEVAMADQYQVSRTTVREALRLLEREGIVRSRHGIGTFISSNADSLLYTFDVLTGLSNILRASGGTADTKLIKISEIPLTEEMRQQFRWPGEVAVELERIRLLNDVPVAYSIDLAPLAYLGGPIDRDQLSQSFFEALQKTGHNPHHTESRLKAIVTPASIAKYMPRCKGRPIVLSHEMVYDINDDVIAVSKDYLDTEQISLIVRRRAIS
ncbi:MAG: GntR family transcriptional regulator [Candidatus Fermentithermobacillus carboniphilus]|uniref:GntR family transcriptional regulator n=1 Tax=Candidatus Fermentithermobacillus carboniphilus TaxID=3085328 RepID=A0AAT9LFK3_9FIRM|nr:MAG: GntR family transcriptional regulator [Candidatus Fermentithermobacillus carboniphilus]